MYASHPLEALSSAIHHARLVVLPEVRYETRDFESTREWSMAQRTKAIKEGGWPMVERVRQPEAHEVEVVAMFPQTWGSTALGFGGIGGAAMTSAYTIVIRGPGRDCAVYWAGRFAYLVPHDNTDQQKEAFNLDLCDRLTKSRREAEEAYGARIILDPKELP